jgi:hypothetical protein
MIRKAAVVGHGPSLHGAKLGRYIDSFEYVLRFPYIGGWQSKTDYGFKTSYYCATSRRARHRLRPDLPELGYFIWSKWRKRGIGSKLKHLIEQCGGKDVTNLIQRWQGRMVKPKYPYFCHGTAAILIALAKLSRPVVVFGCDSLKTGDNDIEKYLGSAIHEPRRSNRNFHDLEKERELINLMSSQYGFPVVFYD